MSSLEKAVLEISKDGIELCEHYSDGSSILKNIGVNDFRTRISKTSSLDSGLLPPGTRYYKKSNRRELVVMESPEAIFDVTFQDNEDEEEEHFRIPVPRSLWMIYLEEKNGKKTYAEGFLFALREPLLSGNTMLYRFPFSNVLDWICWGDNKLPEWNSLIGLYSLPSIFYSGKFNHDLDGDKYKPLIVDYEEIRGSTLSLFRYLNGEKSFPYSCLKEDATFNNVLERYSDKSY